MEPEILNLLQKDSLQNLPVMGFFENYPLEKHLLHGNSLILVGTSDYSWAYLSVSNVDELNVLLERFAFESLYFANVEEWMIPSLTANHRIEWKLATNRYYLPDEVEIDRKSVV